MHLSHFSVSKCVCVRAEGKGVLKMDTDVFWCHSLFLFSLDAILTPDLWPQDFLPRETRLNSWITFLHLPLENKGGAKQSGNWSHTEDLHIHIYIWYVTFAHCCVRVCAHSVSVSGVKVEFNLWYSYQFHGAGGLFGRPTAALTYLCQWAGMHVFHWVCAAYACVY